MIARHPTHSRFADMNTEWLALWLHFLWSGVLTMSCCLMAWWKIGFVVVKASSSASIRPFGAPKVDSETSKVRRRLINTALMVSLCLLLNVTATLSIAGKLKEWSRTSEISLSCEIKETWNTRDFNAYGFDAGHIKEVCSQANSIQLAQPCTTSCYWYPGITLAGLTCEFGSGGHLDGLTLAEQAAYKALLYENNETDLEYDSCDCPCGDLIEIKRPRYGVG
jgi:hypothetical protein